jgi:iron complex outermembrane recepter protein
MLHLLKRCCNFVQEIFFMPRSLIAFLIILPVVGWAQTPDSCGLRLSGHIADEHDDTPLDLATVWLPEANKGAVTDIEGRFEIEGLCPGWYTVQYHHLGCDPGEIRFFLEEDAELNLQLEHHIKWLKSVTVSALRIEPPSAQVRTDLMGWELDRLRGASLAQTLQTITGVRMMQTGPGVAKPVIHGMHSNRISIFNNGVRQEGQEWGADHAPEIDPFSAGRLRVIKGAAALEYGIGAMGGVILSEPDPLPEGAGVKGEAMLIGQSNGRQGTAAAKLQGGSKKFEGFGWRAQGSLHRGGDWQAPRYVLSNTGSAQGGASLGLGYQRGRLQTSAYYSFFQAEWGVLRSAHIGNLTDFQEAIQRDTPFYTFPFTYEIDAPRQWTQHHLAKAEAVFRPEKSGIWSWNYSYQLNARQEFDLRRAGRSAIPALDMDLGTHQSSLSWKPLLPGRHWHANTGVSFQYQQNRNVPGTGVRPLIPWFNSATGGAFAMTRYARENWEVEGGLRYDVRELLIKRFDAQNNLITERLPFQGFSGSLGALFQPASAWKARAQAGVAFRPPHVSELYSEGLHHAVAALEQGDPNLQSEQAIKGIASLEYNPNSSLSLQAEAYYHYVQDYIYLSPLPEPQLTIRGAFPVFEYAQTDAQLWGLDLDARWEFAPRFSFDMEASLLRARDLTQNDHLIFMPADRAEATLHYDWHSNKKLSDAHFSLGAIWVAQQSRVPANVDLAGPPEGYYLLQASASCRFLLGANAVSLFVNATNMLNADYRDYLNRLRYFAGEPGRNIELRLKYDF